ncbi:ECF transporter S component [Spiroplasma culicicola]|uniref:Transmembrane protein n=1 Tax=Spiroplasma culicicola AES-1 TaxID=1276246 RepID=W6A6Q8_9MOLU|nr:ECF transporter S component [Spiroplasma culicicola]AHI52656.1 transmembrane protein [Spiroplasma culicicola AES-1]
MEKDNHNVPEHTGTKTKDHYHDEHHFDALGNHDDVNENDFNFKNSIYTSRKNLIYRISASGVFLALAIVATGIDSLLEKFFTLPLEGVFLPVRYFDIVVVFLSIGIIGPIFASILGLLIPWIHLGFDPVHGPLPSLIDSMGYFVIIWVFWAVYYVIFRNSYIHKDPNRKKDLTKRWVPIAIFVPIALLIYVPLTVWIIYVTNPDHETASAGISLFHDDHDHGHWSAFKEKYLIYTAIVTGFESVRFIACYILFAVLEPQMKKTNHRFR